MTLALAQQCETIWPLGWSVVADDSVVAVCLHHRVSVKWLKHNKLFYVDFFLGNNTAPPLGLPQLLTKVRQDFQDILEAGIPSIVEVPVNQQAAEILQVQGWERGGSETCYMQHLFQVDLCPARVDLWHYGHCVTTIVLKQGKVREQLKELLTFPQWKEP